ncbi:MAG TPA: hypothetical protein VN653_04305, partial [Anaerolineales bacterium]|nr:hypothetical protein [Anaerolineales bacterium]
MPQNFLRAVIFDFGGTLMYGRNAWDSYIATADEALTRYLGTKGIELSVNTFPREFRRRLKEYFRQRENDLFETTYTHVLQELIQEKG